MPSADHGNPFFEIWRDRSEVSFVPGCYEDFPNTTMLDCSSISFNRRTSNCHPPRLIQHIGHHDARAPTRAHLVQPSKTPPALHPAFLRTPSARGRSFRLFLLQAVGARERWRMHAREQALHHWRALVTSIRKIVAFCNRVWAAGWERIRAVRCFRAERPPAVTARASVRDNC